MPTPTQRGASSGDDISTWAREGSTGDRMLAVLRQNPGPDTARNMAMRNPRPARPPNTGEDAWKGHDPIQADWKFAPMVQPQQLKMLMSAREIKNEYQPLEADKQDRYDPREGETTARRYTTEGNVNARLTTYDKEEGFAKYRNNTSDEYYRQYGHTETDNQLWDRKLEESQMPLHEYKDVHGGGFHNASQETPGWNTLMERSSAPKMPDFASAGTATWENAEHDQASYFHRKQGEHYMAKDFDSTDSLHGMLSHAMRPGGEGFTGLVHLGSQFGGSGKREIIGAHHRIAAMSDIDEDRLLPVLHSKNIWDARSLGTSGSGFKYD